MLQKHVRRVSALVLPLFVLLICCVKEGYGQTFSSGSTGADGALNLTTPGTIIFDPVALGLNPAVANVFNFTTINIASGVTVRLTSKALTGPIYWLAQGAVTINGTLDLSGESGAADSNVISSRVAAAGGAGGYNGGVGGALGCRERQSASATAREWPLEEAQFQPLGPPKGAMGRLPAVNISFH